MKRNLKILAIAICIALVAMTLSVFVGCNDNGPSNGPSNGPTLGTITFADATLTSGYVGVEIEHQLTASAQGNPTISFATATGSNLPAGLSISNTGRITGIPTAAASAATFNVVASAEGFNNATATFTITITQRALGLSDVQINAFEGQAISQTLAATGAPSGATITYALATGANFPAWLTFANGTITSAAAVVTTAPIEFGVTASLQHFTTATANVTVNVAAVGEISFVGSNLGDAVINTLFTHTLVASTFSETPVTFAEYNNSLPEWLTLNNGVLTGTPTAADIEEDITFSIQASATDYTSVVREFTISVVGIMQHFDFNVSFTDLDYFVAGGLGYGSAFLGFEGLYSAERALNDGRQVSGLIGNFFMDGIHQWFDPALVHNPLANVIEWLIVSDADTPTTVNLSANMAMRVPGHFCLSPAGTSETGPGGHHFYVNGTRLVLAPGQVEFNTNTSNLYFNMFSLGNITLQPGVNSIRFVRGFNDWEPDDGDPTGPAIELIRISTVGPAVAWAPGFPNNDALFLRGYIQ